MRLIGFSTGGIRPLLYDALHALSQFGVKAAEVAGCHAGKHAEGLAGSEQLFPEFEWVSVHTPKFEPHEERAMASAMTSISSRGHAVVVHPNSISDFNLWLPLGPSLLIENVDLQKGFGQTVADIARIFERLPEARLCFDIGHAYQVDPSMTEGRRFIDAFRSRIGQVHISSVDPNGQHDCLKPDAIDAFRSITPDIPASAPFIHEGAPQTLADIAEEVALMNRLGTVE